MFVLNYIYILFFCKHTIYIYIYTSGSTHTHLYIYMYSLIYSFFWLDDIIASVQAMIKAMHLVKQHDDAKLTDIINGEVHIQNDKLAKGDDITESIVAVPKVVVDPRPASIIAFQKAALITFQTWWMRSSDNICGLIDDGNCSEKQTCLYQHSGRQEHSGFDLR